jgi:uncharacterized protein (DUF362 family)
MATKGNEVYLFKHDTYNTKEIYESLPAEIFSIISTGDTVIIKPNWVLEAHQFRTSEWEQVITHPTLITAVLQRVVERLHCKGKIIITDGPELNANFDKIISHQPLDEWKSICGKHNIILEIIDLREELYIQDKNVTIKKIPLPSDPRGKVVANLINDNSEFYNHPKSIRGYFGAGSDIEEANKAHDGHNNLYSISRTSVEADVFINLPKLKTHKKAGITASLKNLVGINTYRNYLPHNSIGTPEDGGDQFPTSRSKSRIESTLMPFIHQHILNKPLFARLFSPVMSLGRLLFGDNSITIRGGSWYGNDTIWRMILDINKVLFYVNPDGNFKSDSILNMKKYISIVDGIIAGEGNGPKSPEAIKIGYLIAGYNPVSVDAVCANLMDFNFLKVPSIKQAFHITHFPLVDFNPEDILIYFKENTYLLKELPSDFSIPCRPHKGWIGHIENK